MRDDCGICEGFDRGAKSGIATGGIKTSALRCDLRRQGLLRFDRHQAGFRQGNRDAQIRRHSCGMEARPLGPITRSLGGDHKRPQPKTRSLPVSYRKHRHNEFRRETALSYHGRDGGIRARIDQRKDPCRNEDRTGIRKAHRETTFPQPSADCGSISCAKKRRVQLVSCDEVWCVRQDNP